MVRHGDKLVPVYVSPELRRELNIRKAIGGYMTIEETLRGELVEDTEVEKILRRHEKKTHPGRK